MNGFRFFKMNDNLQGGERYRWLFDRDLDPAAVPEIVVEEMRKVVPEEKFNQIKTIEGEFPARTVVINHAVLSDQYVVSVVPNFPIEILAVQKLKKEGRQ